MENKDRFKNIGKTLSEAYESLYSDLAIPETDPTRQRDERYIGLNVYYVRKVFLHVSQEEFGYMAGMSKDTVSNIERGVYIPSVRNLVNISNCVHIAVDFFLYENKAEQIHITLENRNACVALCSS